MLTQSSNIYDLYAKTTAGLTSGEWPAFLSSAAWNFRFDFPEQLMIYAQRPDATACYSFDDWHKKFDRRIKKHTKGIALINDSTDPLSLDYVFDYADTYSRRGERLSHWSMSPKKEGPVSKALHRVFFPNHPEKHNIRPAIESAITSVLDDLWPDLWPEIERVQEDCRLRELKQDVLPLYVRTLIMNSCTAMIFHRCGYDLTDALPESPFDGIQYFDTQDAISILGNTVQKISKQVLREIALTIARLDKEHTHKEEIIHAKQQSDIPASRGVSDPRSELAQSGTAREVRPDAQNLSQGASTAPVHQPSALWDIDGPPASDRTGDSSPISGGQGTSSASEPSTGQNDKQSSLEHAHDLDSEAGRRTGASGDHLPLTAFSDADINAVLQYGSGVEGGKYRIQKAAETSTGTFAAFLRDEYGTGGRSFRYPDGKRGFVDHDFKGIHLHKPGCEDQTLSWTKVRDLTLDLINQGQYLSSEEQIQADRYWNMIESRQNRLVLAESARSFIRVFEKKKAVLAPLDEAIRAFVYEDSELARLELLTTLGAYAELPAVTQNQDTITVLAKLLSDLGSYSKVPPGTQIPSAKDAGILASFPSDEALSDREGERSAPFILAPDHITPAFSVGDTLVSEDGTSYFVLAFQEHFVMLQGFAESQSTIILPTEELHSFSSSNYSDSKVDNLYIENRINAHSSISFPDADSEKAYISNGSNVNSLYSTDNSVFSSNKLDLNIQRTRKNDVNQNSFINPVVQAVSGHLDQFSNDALRTGIAAVFRSNISLICDVLLDSALLDAEKVEEILNDFSSIRTEYAENSSISAREQPFSPQEPALLHLINAAFLLKDASDTRARLIGTGLINMFCALCKMDSSSLHALFKADGLPILGDNAVVKPNTCDIVIHDSDVYMVSAVKDGIVSLTPVEHNLPPYTLPLSQLGAFHTASEDSFLPLSSSTNSVGRFSVFDHVYTIASGDLLSLNSQKYEVSHIEEDTVFVRAFPDPADPLQFSFGALTDGLEQGIATITPCWNRSNANELYTTPEQQLLCSLLQHFSKWIEQDDIRLGGNYFSEITRGIQNIRISDDRSENTKNLLYLAYTIHHFFPRPDMLSARARATSRLLSQADDYLDLNPDFEDFGTAFRYAEWHSGGEQALYQDLADLCHIYYDEVLPTALEPLLDTKGQYTPFEAIPVLYDYLKDRKPTAFQEPFSEHTYNSLLSTASLYKDERVLLHPNRNTEPLIDHPEVLRTDLSRLGRADKVLLAALLAFYSSYHNPIKDHMPALHVQDQAAYDEACEVLDAITVSETAATNIEHIRTLTKHITTWFLPFIDDMPPATKNTLNDLLEQVDHLEVDTLLSNTDIQTRRLDTDSSGLADISAEDESAEDFVQQENSGFDWERGKFDLIENPGDIMLASASSSHILSSSYDEILDYFRLNADIDDRIRFLQEKVYSMGTYHEFGPKDERMGFVGRDEYLYIWTGGTYTNHTAAHAYTWREAVSLISDKLLEKDSFEPSLFDFSFEQNPNDTLPSVSEALNASLATVSVHDTRQNYRMPAETVPLGGPKSRFQHNLAAIRLLKTIELENRFATPEEQEILAKYVGWGGLSDAFDPNKENWESEYHALKTLLTEEEYNATRESTLTSFYTPPEVVDAIYSVLSSLGFTQGNVLDPGCGIGVFSGRLPDAMHKSHIYGIEKDSLSARIARQLYQTHTIAIEGYETSSFPDNFFDVAVGNVPFGNFKVHDHRYDQLNLPIHDYFFAKTIDKLRPRGVIAFITSAGTLDKQNTSFRRYLSQRADLLGAIRLPNTVFKANAGTEVTSDIIFLQKRELPRIDDAEWTELDTRYNPDTDTFEPEINSYFVNHPEMVLGEMRTVSGPHGQEQVCIAREGENLKSALAQACQHIQGQITQPENGLYDQESGEKQERLPAAPDVRNYSFALVNDRVYFREDSEMLPVSLNKTAEARVRGMIRLRDDVRQLIDAQLMDQDDHIISQLQKTLNTDYDAFTAKYGLLNSRGNALAFSDDSSYYLLCSLEHVNDKGEFLGKADMFFKRTIGAQKPILHVDTAQEALTISMGERGCIDFDFMSKLSALSKQQLLSQLQGQIYEDPAFPGHYEIAALYLSGNVRKKLEIARAAEAASPGAWTMNIKALEEVQPKDLGPGDITARLGSTWISKEDITQFMYDLFETSAWHRTNQRVRAEYSPVTNTWNIRNADWDRTNAKATSTYGTQRISGYALLQNALNLKDTKLYDTIDGKQILNQNDTLEAQEKQQLICDAFKEWLWSDPVRAARICREYNDRFNAYVAPTFDGSFLRFHNMNPSITLRPWQKNAIARILLSGNTLLDHAVGAGKTWTMVAAAMEGKALGLCNKSMIVVPNHLVGQWASAIYDLYPNAKVLASTKKDFERKNRKKFCSRIATGDYDIIVIGHSQFERIPLSQERQASGIQSEIDHIIAAIADAKEDESQHFTIKQLERTKRNLEVRLQKLHNSKKRDDVISFEELGVDRLFIDESHNYKNLFLYTKMSNIAGISQTDSQRASDLFLKCRYMDELTGNKGNIHATGTVLSNTMSELYAAQRYLSFDLLQDMDLGTFDQWASTFGETITSVELAPEGTGFRARTRFAKFFNIPELMRLYCQVADIQTKEMLDLPLPNPHYEVVPIPASDIQKEYVQTFAERAKKIRGGGVAPNEDNMLCITNDGRKLALDQRLMDASLPDEPLSKINACVDKAFQFWSQYKDQRLTQLIFCDISVPKPGVFNVYDDIKSKLVTKGIPEEEIRFVQEATTDAQKEALFEKVRKGEVRILLGSTGKLGTGTNVQDLLIANHDLDCPYRPSDLEQRAGRGLRQGNTNDDMFIIRYVTENTFDAYMYQLLEIKQRFISQIHNPNPSVREAVDLDEISMSYAEIKALASGDPRIKERVELEADVQRLSMLASRHDNAQYQLQHRLYHDIPAEISSCEQALKKLRMDQKQIKAHPRRTDDGRYLPVTIKNIPYEKASDIGDAILLAAKQVKEGERIPIAAYGGFTLFIDKTTKGWNGLPLTTLELSGAGKYNFLLSNSNVGIVRRLNSILDKDIPDQISANERKIDRLKTEKKSISQELGKPFPRKGELSSKKARLEQLTHDLDLDTQEEATKTASISETISPDRQSSHLDALIHSAISRQAEQVCRTNPSISVPLHEHL